MVAQLDATDENALIKIGAKDADIAIVAVGEKIEGSILATAILKNLGIPRIIARADDPLHSRILTLVGAHEIISPEAEMGRRMAETLLNPWLNHFAELDDGELIAGVISPLREMHGKSIVELNFFRKYNGLVILMEHQGKKFIPTAETTIDKEDKIWIFGKRDDLQGLLEKADEEGSFDLS